MSFNNPWDIGSFSHDYYRALQQQQAAQQAGSTSSQESSPTRSPEASGVLQQLSDLQLSRRGAPAEDDGRIRRTHLGGSTRVPEPSNLLARDTVFSSTRYDGVGLHQTRTSPWDAQPVATQAYEPPSAPSSGRKGFMSGLKKAFGFGGSRKDTSVRHDSAFRADTPPPGHGLAQYAPLEGDAVDATVTPHRQSPPAAGPAPQARPAPRRRPRDDARDAIRRAAGSAMHAEETTLSPLDLVRRNDMYEQDGPLIERAQAGLKNPGIPKKTREHYLGSLTHLSAWLKQVGKDPMQGRLFSDELTSDAWKFIRLGGSGHATAALQVLREMETSTIGIANIPKREQQRDREVPPADQALIEAALGMRQKWKAAARTFSEWLALNGHPPLTAPGALHSSAMDELVKAYLGSPGSQYHCDLRSTLRRLRTFDATGAVDIKRRSHHFDIPEVDQRLLGRYQAQANAELRRQAQQENKPEPVDKSGRTKIDKYVPFVRGFSGWLQEQGLPSIAARLHDGTLMGDVERCHGKDSIANKQTRTVLKHLPSMFPPEAPGVTIARIGRERFVNALGSLAPNTSVADVAGRVGADADDLLVFLDARSETGLTRAGQELVNTFDGRLRQAAEANIALRQQMMAMAAQGMGQAPMSSPILATPVGWSQISWSDDAPAHQAGFGPAGSAQPGTNTTFGDLSSINSGAHYGGHGFDLNTPSQEVTQPAGEDSAYEGLSSFVSLPGYGGRGFDLNTPSQEVTQPAGEDSAYEGLSSFVSLPGYGGRGFDLNTPSQEVTQPAGEDSAYEGLSSFVSLPGYGDQGSYPSTPSEVAGPSRPAHEIVDVDDYPSPQAAPLGAAQRLAHDPWLRDNDLFNYTQMVVQAIAQEMGPGGYQRLTQTLDIADPQQVRRLNDGSARQRAEVLNHFTAPILFLPVNHDNRHWSLLVVNRPAQQAFHYDSMIPPEHAHAANSTPQFEVAHQVATILGAGAPMGMPMALQRDGHSCGDHVLAGIEALARRILSSQGAVQMDLSDIQPSRQRIVDTLIQYEQFTAQAHAAQAPQQPRHGEARPRKKRG